MTIKFNEKSHRYWVDGKPCPGVTTLLGKGLPKDALPYWSARTVAEYVADNPAAVDALRDMGRESMVAALKGVPWEKRDQAAARGTEVHALAELVVHGAEVDVPEHIAGHVDGYARLLDELQIVPVLTERSVANRTHWYAGRFDLIADLGGTRWMLDLKTSSNVYGDTALQVDAYRHAEAYVDDDDPDTEHPMPEGIERLGVIHVTEDGSHLYPLQSDGSAWRVFQHVAWVAKRRDDIKGFIATEPLTQMGITA